MTDRHLAELNVGRLVAPTGDPRVADFMANLDRVNGLGKRMPGFVWMMEGSGEPGTGNTETKIDGDPQYVSNLTVWESVETLEAFVFKTIHKQFYDRRQEWFEILGEQHFVMWWVPEGHRPTLEEALERLERRKVQGDSDEAFGWSWLREQGLMRTQGCVAAE
ncbi:DUF3291 domain-containing protein [Silicimonas algicola]|uniref:Uncharacterized protein DUF3291 n=1 Tax=Silicimonas algicola TaxID=1826607 RepID=A0A316G9B8_9RHOB|nr:DUF3291 domain-containing protein [Silicimonas algicola]AZQ68057.1 DUF3291 domain-containing protein [Silicimonas algicola]PWK57494.1 uncharacterized protein DUF3291 [Silicimonas algicola]